ncbi:MAG: hypothetical protein J6C39_05815, partial [Clostridia bacterium]|nr:hypothetical protein [Clostridia bacterium]
CEYLCTGGSFYRQLLDFGGMMLHSSAVVMNGYAYLFSAPCGTGKSTHTRFWRETFGDRVVMINDDKPLIKITGSGATVYGTPWCGKHNLGENISAPLFAIVSLERSKVNRVEKSDSKKSFPKIFSQTYRTKNILGLQKTLALTDKMLNSVQIFELGCNMDPEAAIVAYNGMKGI